MCGISGVIFRQPGTDTQSVLKRMNDAIAHRGPDAEGTFISGNIGLGHRRLSIIDTSSAGNQPFFSEDRSIVVVFNGEIYNYLELKTELAPDFHFSTSTDTEVIIAAYRKWGADCVHHFIGMFALALWDASAGKLLIFRDRLGIKPLYIAETSECIVFASEIRAILKSGLIRKKLNRRALTDYLRYQTVHAPDTMIEGVQMLMPGHCMIWSEGERSTKQFWNPNDYSGKQAQTSPDEAKQRVRELLQSAVEFRMRADVPFGAFLSGGIDSSIVVGLMSERSSHPVKTFSVTFHEKEFDESPYSQLISKRFGTDHKDIRLSANDFLKTIPAALEAMDHPSGDGPNTYVISEVTRREGVKMALSGLGGDELFAGYDVFRRIYALEHRKWIAATPRIVRALTGNVLQKMKPGVASEKISELLRAESPDLATAYKLTRQVWMDGSIRKLLGKEYEENNKVQSVYNQVMGLPGGVLSHVSIAEITTYMQNILLRDTDQMSMRHALEIRVPFLDHRLVEYVLGLDDHIKYPHSPKQLLVDSMKGLIPDEVVNRPKMGFTFPWAVWMREDLRSYCEKGLDVLREKAIFDKDFLNETWNLFLKGDRTFAWSRMWPLVVLGHWIHHNDIDA